jgi:hypothetical protein
MTNTYQQKLIKLANEIKQIIETENTSDYPIFMSKLNYLLGFILALEEGESVAFPACDKKPKYIITFSRFLPLDYNFWKNLPDDYDEKKLKTGMIITMKDGRKGTVEEIEIDKKVEKK